MIPLTHRFAQNFVRQFGPTIPMKEVSSRLAQEAFKAQEITFRLEEDLQKQKEKSVDNGLSQIFTFLKQEEREKNLAQIYKRIVEGREKDPETLKMIDQVLQEEEDDRNSIPETGTLLEQNRMKFWSSFSKKPRVIGDLAQKTLDEVLKKDPSPGVAVELGCGNSGLVIELLKRSWTVIALDSSFDVLKNLARQVHAVGLNEIAEKKLVCVCGPMEEYLFPKNVSFVFGENSFPYSKADQFEALWDRIHGSLKTDGCIGGNLWVRPINQEVEIAQRENAGVWYSDMQMTKALLKDKGYDVSLLHQKGGWEKGSLGAKIEFIGRKR